MDKALGFQNWLEAQSASFTVTLHLDQEQTGEREKGEQKTPRTRHSCAVVKTSISASRQGGTHRLPSC